MWTLLAKLLYSYLRSPGLALFSSDGNLSSYKVVLALVNAVTPILSVGHSDLAPVSLLSRYRRFEGSSSQALQSPESQRSLPSGRLRFDCRFRSAAYSLTRSHPSRHQPQLSIVVSLYHGYKPRRRHQSWASSSQAFRSRVVARAQVADTLTAASAQHHIAWLGRVLPALASASHICWG